MTCGERASEGKDSAPVGFPLWTAEGQAVWEKCQHLYTPGSVERGEFMNFLTRERITRDERDHYERTLDAIKEMCQ